MDAALKSLLSEELLAAARNRLAAAKAAQEGRDAEAGLFSALAAAQDAHAARMLLLIRGRIGETGENLDQARQGVLALVAGYEQALAAARDQGATPPQALVQFLATARAHLDLLDRPGAPSAYLVCAICGQVAAGRAPKRCPVCGAVQDKFTPAR